MKTIHRSSILRRVGLVAVVALVFAFASAVASAHPLGNFTINHFTRIEVSDRAVKLHNVIDMAEIPTFQELQQIDKDGDGKASATEVEEYANLAANQLARQVFLTIDGTRVPLNVLSKNVSLPAGAGGLSTLRIEFDLGGQILSANTGATHELEFHDNNYSDRIGWREIVVMPAPGVKIFNSSAFGNGLSDQLRAYPQDRLSAPLDERAAQLSFSNGAMPAGAHALVSRDGRIAEAQTRDRLAELIAVPNLTPGLVLIGLLFAIVLGAAHALSPGHGKTVVGAYLVGSRGTARHAAFLGLTVTITHTAGVFALGLVTLLASEYVAPEKLFPFLSLISGGIVVAIGLSLFVRRLRKALRTGAHTHDGHTHDHEADHQHEGINPNQLHSHGGSMHSHLPPGADGSPLTWKSLLALGVSGGILPCPSALVVLLASISLHRVGYGLLLVLAFSVGLAGVLTGVGLAFVYAGRLLKSVGTLGKLSRVLPIVSAFVITCAGLAISYQALAQAGIDLHAIFTRIGSMSIAPSFASVGTFGLLGLGLVYGIRHATEADHIVAVSTIVTEHRKLWRAALVGALWGTGHTASLVVVGAIVLALKIAIPERIASGLEFLVALMIIALGVMAFRRALRRRADFHVHRHDHELSAHSHFHFHEGNQLPLAEDHSHRVARIGFKPTIVGAVHGLAGSAALTLLVLTQIDSPALGLLYLGIFGAGSILGMLLMSGLVGLPFVLTSRRLAGAHFPLQLLASLLSIVFGLAYAYETGFAGWL
ncbi:MAG TPA: hypothetical protein VIF81_05545 [Pyrinomonadaceae bacterium]